MKQPHDDWLRSVNFEIQVPRVIRLLVFDRLPKQKLHLNRRNVLARDGHVCQYCGRHFPTHLLSIDHVVPRSRGGETTWENVVCACLTCNVRKGGRTPREAHMKLTRPHPSETQPVAAVAIEQPQVRMLANLVGRRVLGRGGEGLRENGSRFLSATAGRISSWGRSQLFSRRACPPPGNREGRGGQTRRLNVFPATAGTYSCTPADLFFRGSDLQSSVCGIVA